MFEGLSQLANLMKQLPRIREEASRLQERVGQIAVEGDAGAGMVKVKVNGRMEITACTISDEAWKLNDREMLEDLIKSAINQAIGRARQKVAEETNKMATELGLPPGMELPGMG
jgi:DNA-binding YbaB/EbfC family protein